MISHTKKFLESHISSPEQQGLLLSLIDHFLTEEPSPYLEIPLLVHGGITGSVKEALPLGSLGAFLFLGMDIIDDIADGDSKDHWPQYNSSELELASSLFLSALPQLLISGLKAPPCVLTKIQRRFAQGILNAAEGQQKELIMKGKTDILPKEVEHSVAGKSSGLATLAFITACFAKASKDQINYYEEMGGDLGIAAQLTTDFYDLFQAPLSRDLKNGIRTLPIVLYLEKCSVAERKTFLKLLKDARKNPIRRKDVRSLLLSKGIARLTAFIVELYCERARKKLNLAGPNKNYQEKIASHINNMSFFAQN